MEDLLKNSFQHLYDAPSLSTWTIFLSSLSRCMQKFQSDNPLQFIEHDGCLTYQNSILTFTRKYNRYTDNCQDIIISTQSAIIQTESITAIPSNVQARIVILSSLLDLEKITLTSSDIKPTFIVYLGSTTKLKPPKILDVSSLTTVREKLLLQQCLLLQCFACEINRIDKILEFDLETNEAWSVLSGVPHFKPSTYRSFGLLNQSSNDIFNSLEATMQYLASIQDRVFISTVFRLLELGGITFNTKDVLECASYITLLTKSTPYVNQKIKRQNRMSILTDMLMWVVWSPFRFEQEHLKTSGVLDAYYSSTPPFNINVVVDLNTNLSESIYPYLASSAVQLVDRGPEPSLF